MRRAGGGLKQKKKLCRHTVRKLLDTTLRKNWILLKLILEKYGALK
jgi:hypothetical protein